MVLLASRDGIGCDFCGTEYRSAFSYYSGKIDKVRVDQSMGKEHTEIDRRFLDFDMCESCHAERVITPMMEVIQKRELKRKKK